MFAQVAAPYHCHLGDRPDRGLNSAVRFCSLRDEVGAQHRTPGQPRHLSFTRALLHARVVTALIKNAKKREVGHRYESPEFATQVSRVPQVEA